MAIRTILEKGSSSLGDEFFHVMAKELAQILNADFTLIGTLSESDEGLIDTVSFCAHGEQQSNFGYELAGTPCDEVIGHKICHFPEGVADLFPEDLMLADNGIEGYVGVPLFDTRGKPLGLMAALYCEPIENEEFPSAVMFVFAQRIAAEIERLALAAERRQFETQMSHTQKLESIGVMAGGIADDFNNLLCGILGSADLVAHKIGEDHEANENLQMITKTAQSASELCSPILAYSGKGRCAIEPLNATVVLEEMSDLLEMSVSNNVRIVRALDNALPRIEADRSQIQQIIFNLVVNGSEAIGEDSGTITIVTGAMDCSAEYLSTTYLEEGAVEGSYVFVEISDTGSGLEQQALERLFDPFFTTKLTGRGLGLAATLEIIRGHKGSIK
ncbi:MAG: two-component system cell cycle sensor histidine kinase/response regulator CckA, partial [Planctomycetota bacterium]